MRMERDDYNKIMFGLRQQAEEILKLVLESANLDFENSKQSYFYQTFLKNT